MTRNLGPIIVLAVCFLVVVVAAILVSVLMVGTS